MRLQDRQTHTHTTSETSHPVSVTLVHHPSLLHSVYRSLCVCVFYGSFFFFLESDFDLQVSLTHKALSKCTTDTLPVCVSLCLFVFICERVCAQACVCVCVCLQALLCECVCVCLCLLCAAGTELITVLLEILIHPEPTETHIHSQHRCLWWASVCVFMCVCSLWLSLIGANQLKAWDRSVSLANSCDQQTAAFCSPQE